MSKHCAKSGIGKIQIHLVWIQMSDHNMHDRTDDDCLEQIADKYDQSGFLSEYPEGIRCSSVAASMLSNINAFHSSIDIRCLKQSKCIACHQTDHSR